MKVDLEIGACYLARHPLKARKKCQLLTERSGPLLWAMSIERDLVI